MWPGPSRTEHRHRRTDGGERIEALDELGLNAQHTPLVGVHPVAGPARVQQALIGGAALFVPLVTAQDDRALVPLRRALRVLTVGEFCLITHH